MSNRLFAKNRVATRSVVSVIGIAAAVLLLVACAPAYNTRPGYYGGQQGGYSGGQQCYQGCGYVREVRQVQLQNGNSNGAAIGTVIGAVVGGLIGNQVGGGKGKTAATVAGAVGGGFAGHAIGERSGNGGDGWQVVVQLNNGQYATVTQRSAPQVRVGDYVMVRNNQVYRY
ncbi:MAG TPA: glycine zipper 2TM domain-containing protein [Rhodanobacteraceae bacterium]|jgi:outer membrane lipoprotein SlyB|nr:glycine zipper 2TM domain-containing protein [Rhodanobacteraceae bacterium]